MRTRTFCTAAVVLAVAAVACGNKGSTGSGGGQGTGGADVVCPPCLQDSDCAIGSKCGQFAGTTACAPDCSVSSSCAEGRVCTPVNGFDGSQDQLCLPTTDVCGVTPPGNGGSGGGGGAGGGASTTTTTTTTTTSVPVITGMVGPKGGELSLLNFAVVGDTRPPAKDDTAHYPTAIITKIWKDIEAHAPHPSFAVTTGDYMFASPGGTQSGPQLATYLKARANFSSVVFPALGNHECTGGTDSNCGTGNADGNTNNYKTFMDEMLVPLGQSEPYYVIDVSSNVAANPWTAKFVFIACNAWSSKQSSWLSTTMAKSTTYTFVVQHETATTGGTPCYAPAATILAAHPYTLRIVGHVHTYSYDKSHKEVIVGTGGAPLSSSVPYGYLIAEQQPNGNMRFSQYDYSTNAVVHSFTVTP